MCGIVGVYQFDAHRPVDERTLFRQTDSLVHRGPDGGGVWTSPGIGLGHRRLSIIDIDGGAQPMADKSGRYVVVFNGEIYNYRELRERLLSLGSSFRSDSDTEVLLAAYAEWGPACLEHLNGMFAFAIYDRDSHELFLARDRLGQKPLYYYHDRERLIFASEIKAILADPMVPREIRADAVADFFALSYIPGPKSIFHKIEKLSAGHYLHCRGSIARERSYWSFDFSHVEDDASLEECASDLRELLVDSVRLRMRSDVPLGAFLSGGLDSSAVVGAMRAQPEKLTIRTQAVGFDTQGFDERHYAKHVAAHFGSQHSEQLLSPEAGEVIRQLPYFYDEPFGDSSAAPSYYLCAAARKEVTVALSGDGGDEPFAGYDHYAMYQWTNGLRPRIPTTLWKGLHRPLRGLMQLSRYNKTASNYNLYAFLASAPDPDRNAYHHFLPQPYRYRELLSDEFVRELDDYDPFHSIRDHFRAAGTDDPVLRMQYCDLKSYLCDDILVKVDRASMAHSLEVRSPLLDHRIIELATRIPLRHKMTPERKKIVLAEAVAPWIAPETFERPKQGFAIPLHDWFRGPLAARTAEALWGSPRRSRLVSEGAARRMLFEEERGLASHGHQLWNALNFELWFERYMSRIESDFDATARMEGARKTQPVAL